MKPIKQTYQIAVAPKLVWQALTDPSLISMWGGGPAKMDARVNTKFSLWGGTIWGKNIKVVPERELVQEWFSEEDPVWKEPSIVTFSISPDGTSARLELLQTNVPDANWDDIASGWQEYYLGPLKEFLEKSAKLL